MIYNILISDTSVMINEVLKFAFENQEFTAKISTDNEKISELINTEKFDLFLLKNETETIELIKKIRQSEKNNKAEIFIISGEKEDKRKKEYQSMGVTGWVVKPIIPEKFVKTVKFYLNKIKRENTNSI